MRIEIRPSEGGADSVSFAAELIDACLAATRRAGITAAVESTDRTTTITVPGDHL